MKTKRKHLIELIIVALLAVGIIMPLSLQATDYESFDTYVDSVTLSKSDGTPLGPDPSLKLSDGLMIRFNLKDLNVSDFGNIQGKTFEVNIPAYIAASTGLSRNITIEGTLIGRVYYDVGEQKTLFTFADNLGEDTISQGYFEFSSNLDEEQIAGRQSIDIPLTGTGTVNIIVEDNAVADPTMESKTGVYDKTTGEITWTVTLGKEIALFDNGALQYTTGYIFLDDLGDKEDYIDGSLNVKIGNTDNANATVSIDTTDGKNQLKAIINEGISDTTTITYKTKPNAKVFVGENNVFVNMSNGATVTNSAQLYDTDETTKLGEKTANVSVTGEEWMTKVGSGYDIVNKTVTWEITINTNGLTFDEIKLYDELPNGLSFDKSKASVTITGSSAGTVTVHDDAFTGKGSEEEVANNLLTIANANGTYVVEYTTPFDNDLNQVNDSLPFENKAWLAYEWDDDGDSGTDPGIYGIPTVNSPYRVPTSIIEKSGAYNGATRRITWTVTLNKNKLDVTNAVITDTIDTTNQRYVANTAQIKTVNGATPPEDYGITMTNTGSVDRTETYNVVISKSGVRDNYFGSDTVVFTYETEATDPQFYGCNATQHFNNTATFKDDYVPLQTAVANPSFESKVFKKEVVSYDYSNHQINWRVTVNESGGRLTNVVFEDKLPSYLRYVDGTLKVDNASVDPTTTDITYNMGDITGKKVITFATELNVNANNLPDGFNFTSSNTASGADRLSIENDAVLKKTEGADVTETATATISNTLLDKKSVVKENEYTINYELFVNQAGADMRSVFPDGYKITDTMSENLILDVDTVEVYEATIDARGNFVVDSNADPVEGVTATVDENKMEITIPTKTKPTASYVVRYTTYVNYDRIGTVSIGNSVTMGDTAAGVGAANNVDFYSAYSNGSATRIPGRASVKLIKTITGEENTFVEGAVYELYGFYSGTDEKYLMQTVTTDAKGEAMFTALSNKEGSNKYIIKEKSAPTGIALDEREHEITVTVLSGQTQVFETTDDRIRGEITFLVVDQNRMPVKGAKFNLYNEGDDPETDDPIATAYSDENGRIIFTDLDLSKTYKFVQVETPENYHQSTDTYTATVDENGNVTIVTENGQPMTGDVTNRRDILNVPSTNDPSDNGPLPDGNVSPKLPATGDEAPITALLITLIIASSLVGTLAFGGKKY